MKPVGRQHSSHIRKLVHASLCGLVLASAAGTVWAHGGEDHGADAPAPMGTPIAPRAYAQTPDFELVAQLHGGTLTLTVDRFATNEPVADAQIEVESGTALKALAQQTAPGVYTVQADALATPGRYPLSVSVQAGDVADLLSATLDVAPPSTALAHTHNGGEWTSWGLSAAVLSAGLALLVVRRAKRARRHTR